MWQDILALSTIGVGALIFLILWQKEGFWQGLGQIVATCILFATIMLSVGFFILIGWSIDRITCGGYCSPLVYFGVN